MSQKVKMKESPKKLIKDFTVSPIYNTEAKRRGHLLKGIFGICGLY